MTCNSLFRDRPHRASPARALSGESVIQVCPSMLRVRRNCDEAGMPVIGSRRVLSSERVQEGVMRRSERTRILALGVVSWGTVMVRGMS